MATIVKEVIKTVRANGIHKLDLSQVDEIRSASKNILTDPSKLETELLPYLGLNDEMTNEFPESLSYFFGTGLYSWKYPNQFSKYLAHLSNYKIESYCEIGVRHGGTFIITVEYLNRFHKCKKAIGIDTKDNISLPEYKKIYNDNIDFFRIDSQNILFKRLIKEKYKQFDLVLIDGAKSYWGCRCDFEIFKDRANIIVLHDITNYECPEINDLWIELQESLYNQFNFYEFTDQYKNIQNKGKYYLGIGIMVDKGFDFCAK